MENMPGGQARPIPMSWEKSPLPWACLGCGTPASSTQSSVSQLRWDVGHPMTVPCHGCVGLGSIVLPLYGVISHPAWAEII